MATYKRFVAKNGLTTASIAGGTGTTSSLILKPTTGAGTTTSDIVMQVGTDGDFEVMRVRNNGNVGVGTAAPTAKLDINGTLKLSSLAYPQIVYNSENRLCFGENTPPPNDSNSIVAFGSGSATRNMIFQISKPSTNSSYFGNDGTGLKIGVEMAYPIVFATALDPLSGDIMNSGIERMRIDGIGRVGINNAAPADRLDVVGTIRVDSTAGPSIRTSGNRLTINEPGNGPPNETGFVTQYSSGIYGRCLFAITHTGVNTAFFGLDNNVQFALGAELDTPIVFRQGMDYGAADIINSGSEKMRVHTNGFVGINTATPTTALEVAGVATATSVSTGLGLVTLPAYNFTGDTNTGMWSPAADTLAFSTAGVERARVSSTGLNVVGVVSTNGVKFPAVQVSSADVNTLDDYEEGTWTATIAGTTTAGVGTYTTQVARYTKIGRVVHVNCRLVWTAHTGTGNMQINGLPFACENVANSWFGVSLGAVANIVLTAGNVMTANIQANTSIITLQQYPTGGGASAAVLLDIAGTLVVSATYQAAT